MELPAPTAAHERLAAFEGTWEGDETLDPAPWRPQAQAARGRFENRRVLGGLFLRTEYEESRDGAVIFGGMGMYGHDQRTGDYTMHWFDRIGMAPEKVIRGRFAGDVLTFEADGPGGRVQYVYELIGADRFAFTIRASSDGGATWTRFMRGEYRRA